MIELFKVFLSFDVYILICLRLIVKYWDIESGCISFEVISWD